MSIPPKSHSNGVEMAVSNAVEGKMTTYLKSGWALASRWSLLTRQTLNHTQTRFTYYRVTLSLCGTAVPVVIVNIRNKELNLITKIKYTEVRGKSE